MKKPIRKLATPVGADRGGRRRDGDVGVGPPRRSRRRSRPAARSRSAGSRRSASTDNFDPTGEYLGDGWGVLTTEVKTLVGYEHAAGALGNKIVPDLATSVPTPTNGGKTYTFHLKPNIKFGPPVNRAITSEDFVTAMDRLANPKDGGEYAFYYTVIKGWNAYAAGKAKSISGITTPNPTHDRLQPDAADRRLPLPDDDARDRPAAGRGDELLRRAARQVRPGPDLDRPVHAEGDRQHQHLVVQDDQARHAGLRRSDDLRRRPQPELEPDDRPVLEELPGRDRLHRSTRATSTSTTRSRPASSTWRLDDPAGRARRSTRRRRA